MAFTITPSPQVVGVGQQAVYRCLNPTANAISWRWNGSVVIDSSPPAGITLGMTMDGNRNVRTLTIVAQPNYNETEVVCVAIIIVGQMSQNEETTPVSLLIQGGTKLHGNLP